MKYLILCLSLIFTATANAQCPPADQSNYHVVQKGETLYSIARRYNKSVSDIKRINGLSGNLLSVCQQLKIGNPTPEAFSTTKTKNPIVPSAVTKPFNQYRKQVGKYHIVQMGETVENIARLYGYTTERFREFNNLGSFQSVVTGQQLRNTDCDCNTPTSLSSTSITKEADARIGAGVRPNTSTTTTTTNTGNSSSFNLDADKYSYLKPSEKDMIREINLVRSNPRGYIPYIKEYIESVKNSKMSFGAPVATSYELIDQLENTPPLSILEPKECVYQAARKHGEDRKAAGSNDHVGTDGSWPWDRILKTCPDLTDGNENLVGGPSSIRRAVILLLVDDGIPNHGHRTTLLNPKWKYVATYNIGTVGQMPNSWVQKFAY